MAIYDDVKITINLNELVEIRAKLQSQYGDYSEQVCKGEYLDESDIDRIATQLRNTYLGYSLLYGRWCDTRLLGFKRSKAS